MSSETPSFDSERTRVQGDGDAPSPPNDDATVVTGRGDDARSPAAGASSDRFTLIRELGRGGQAVVHLAEDNQLHRRVALKMVDVSGFDDQALLRFEREARVASKLEHPGICPVYDVGRLDGKPFIAMRFVEGAPLSTLINRSHAVDPTTQRSIFDDIASASAAPQGGATSTRTLIDEDLRSAIDLVIKLARALDAAHEAGIVHRDLKPGNVMITPDGHPVILDFGLAADLDDAAVTLTQSGEVFGTPAYMSPEQARGDKTDRGTDVWALGVILYELVCGLRPFRAPTRDGLYHAICNADPPRLRRIDSRISRDLESVIETALEKDRGRRYSTAGLLADDLEHARDGRPVSARRIGWFGRGLRWARRHKAAAAVILLIVTGLPVVAALGTRVALTWGDVEAQRIAERDREVERLVNLGFMNLAPEYGMARRRRAHEALERACTLDPHHEAAAAGYLFSLLFMGEAEQVVEELEGRRARFRGRPVFRLLENSAKVDLGLPSPGEFIPPPIDELDAVTLFLFGRWANSEFHVDGDPRQAERAYRHLSRAVKTAPRPRLMYFSELAIAALDTGRKDEAHELGRAMTRLWPDHPEGLFYLGVALMDRDDARASRAFQRATEVAPDLAGAWQNLSVVHRRAGRSEESLVAARRAMEIDDESPLNRLAYANALFEVGRLEEAEEHARRSIELLSPNPPALTALSIILETASRHDAADEVFEAEVARHPDNAAVLEAVGGHHLRCGRFDSAAKLLGRAHELAPESHSIAFNFGIALLERFDFITADRVLADLSRRHPDDVATVCQWATALARLERLNEADRLLTAIDDSTDWRPYFLRGQILRSLGRYIESEQAFERASALGAANVDELIANAAANIELELHAKALESGEAVSFESQEQKGLVAETLARRGSWDQAVALFRPMVDDILDREGLSRARTYAGLSLAMAGTGATGELSPEVLRSWRDDAADLLEEDLLHYESTTIPLDVIHFVGLWSKDDLRPLRAFRGLAGADAAERETWSKLFERIERLRDTVFPRN